MTLTLHEHPFASYCWNALIALYERDIEFEKVEVNDQTDRDRLAKIWPMAGMPVLVDDEAGRVVPESSIVIEYLDRFGEAPPMVPANPEQELEARLWDGILDVHVMTPMQKIVADALRLEREKDEFGVEQARSDLETAYGMLDTHLTGREWAAGENFTIADCSAAPSLFYARVVHRWDEQRLEGLTSYFRRLTGRDSVARVIDEARYFREYFPLPWPEYADQLPETQSLAG